MADLDIDNAIDNETLYGQEIYHDPEIYWQTQFKGLVPIKEMNTQHIENTLKMLERKDMQDHPSYFALVLEYESRIHEILAQ